MAKNTSAIIYRGPSMIDGSPIVVVTQKGTSNRKTGDMVQTYILRDDMDPVTANRCGADKAICGDCPLKGTPHDGDKGQAKGRGCYVTLAHGPLGKWKGLQKGLYPTIEGHEAIKGFGAGRMVRIGTYGDGAAVPGFIWDSLCEDAEGWTAYTHQNRCSGAATDPKRYMTSADSASAAKAAWKRGERTFRVVGSVQDLVPGAEILCPASEEAGKRTDCASCKLCAGASVKAKSIAIVAHGTSAKAAKSALAA